MITDRQQSLIGNANRICFPENCNQGIPSHNQLLASHIQVVIKASSPDVRRRAGHVSEKALQVSASVIVEGASDSGLPASDGRPARKTGSRDKQVEKDAANEAHEMDPPLSGLVTLDNGARAGGARAGGARVRGGQVGGAAQEDKGSEFLGMHVQKKFTGLGTFRGRV